MNQSQCMILKNIIVSILASSESGKYKQNFRTPSFLLDLPGK